MPDKVNTYEAQLKQTCRITGARWATWIEKAEYGWFFGNRHGLNKSRQASLNEFLCQPQASSWLAGAISGGRMRSCRTATAAADLKCQQLYAFPNAIENCAIVVGANVLDDKSRAFFRVLAMHSPQESYPKLSIDDRLLIRPFENEGDTSYNLTGVLERILNYLITMEPADVACIAMRVGDAFRIEATLNSLSEKNNLSVSVHDDPILAEILANRKGIILTDATKPARLRLKPKAVKPVKAWMIVPILIGQQVIGLVVYGSHRADTFTHQYLRRVVSLVSRIAHGVEVAIVFSETSRYLQQMALLNELASPSSGGVGVEEAVNRVRRMLMRTFRTCMATVLLLSSDGLTLREYSDHQQDAPRVIPVESSLAGVVVETGMPIRVGDAGEIPGYKEKYYEIRSQLSVPLKYRGEVMGVLTLDSPEANAFSSQDQQLLVVIASHLAMLIENVRLNTETHLRASNLSLIHQVVRHVVGLTDVSEIAQLASKLMANYFDYEFACVLLLDEKEEYLVIEGVGGSMAHLIQRGISYPAEKGVTGHVLKTGNSYISNDVSQDPLYFSLLDWQANSEMCVPLKEGHQIFGLINVERSQMHVFQDNDLLVLEALAGVLSSVMMNARRYQQLRGLVGHLRASQETALDISADLDLRVVLKRVVHRVRELVGARGAELALVDEKDQVVKVVVSENPWLDYTGYRIPLMAGVSGRVAALGKALVITDYNSWPDKFHQQVSFRSMAGVPLKYKDQVIGVLTVADDRLEKIFSSEDVQLLELLAPQVAVSIHNAQLYKDLQEHIEVREVAESQLIRSARLAAVGELAAGVAHELNNPLTTVTGFVELILEELPVDAPQRPDLELVLREARRARGVVRQLLDFSRPVENLRISADLSEMVSEVLTLVKHLARTNGVKIHRDLLESLPEVCLDPNQIKQVLLNLIHNALQAMPLGGTLTIQTLTQEREGRKWLGVRVRDTGEGIAPDVIDRLFEPFFTTRQPGSGTGLGLSVSYGIVREHCGCIEVNSQPGEGSCFTMWLPGQEEE